MHLYGIRKSKRIAAGLLAAGLLVLMLFSVFFIALEVNHECSGEDCPICVCVQQCENTAHRIADGLCILAVSLLPILLCLSVVSLPAIAYAAETPVLNKVRLNN